MKGKKLLASYAIASETASQVETILKDIDWKPDKIIVSECGAVFFIWDKSGKYADIECTCEGDVLCGMTDFNGINIVNDLKLNISSFLKFKKEYENFYNQCFS